jgi:hypothetical protein
MSEWFFPVVLDASAFALGRGAVSITLDLASNEPELWIALVADGKDECGDIVGYLRFAKRLTQRPGLSTYAVVEARPPHDPPPNPASFQTIFRWPSLAAYESLSRARSARAG